MIKFIVNQKFILSSLFSPSKSSLSSLDQPLILVNKDTENELTGSGVPRGFWGVSKPPEIPKALQNRAKLNPIVETVKKNSEFRTPTPQDARKKGSKILKLPPVRNFFKLGMTNKLVFIINSLKVSNMKILQYEMKFLVPNYTCLQNR